MLVLNPANAFFARNQLEEALEKLKKAENLYSSLTDKWSTPEALDAEEHHLEYLLGSKEKIPRLSKYSILIEEEGNQINSGEPKPAIQSINHIGQIPT